MMRRWRTLGGWVAQIAGFAALCAPVPAAAWGPLGHQIVAEIADRHLSAQARAMVEDLLGAPSRDALRDAATWADEIRASEELGITAPYHYVNFPLSTCAYEPARDCPGGRCVVAATQRFARRLIDGESRDSRATALKWVLHLVADVHQPLHAGYAQDRGGNDLQLRWRRSGTNLHALLDSGLIAQTGLRPAPYADALLVDRPAPDPGTLRWHATAPVAWAEESCRLVPSVYPPDHRISREFADQTRAKLEQRLVLAGLRLARMLDAAANSP